MAKDFKLKPFKIFLRLICFTLCFLAFSFLLKGNIVKAASASLWLSPSSGSFEAGKNFSVDIYVSSAEQSMNAVSGVVNFPSARLEMVSISKTGSIIGLWVQEPSFSNSSGAINFEGIVLNPGFTGATGKILTLNFKGKTEGSASLNFSSGSILANDGKGTNILSGMSGGNYTIKSTAPTPGLPVEEYVPSSTAGTPNTPIVSSVSCPDPEKWCSNNDPEFTWKLPPDVTGVSFLLHKKPDTNPGNTPDGLIESKKYENIEDGVWYFHIKFKNQYGWGKILHRKIMIDTVPPTIFKIIIDKKGILTNPSPVLYFESTDVPSGIEYYEVIIDREKKILAKAEAAAIADIKRNPFQMPSLTPGTHTIEVKAFDKAENFSLTETDVEITPIELPEITKIPTSIDTGDILEIQGKALPNMMVRIYFQKGEEGPILEKIKTDSEGNFVLNYNKTLPEGEYLVWAQTEDEIGALSNLTKKYSLRVGLPPFLKLGKIAINYASIIIILIILIAGAIIIIFYCWYKISRWRKRLKKETRDVARNLAKSFHALRQEVQEQVENLDKRPGLTKKEKEVRDKLQEALDISEEFIKKELKDIEKELK